MSIFSVPLASADEDTAAEVTALSREKYAKFWNPSFHAHANEN
jgi:hypothetical protein